MRRRNSFPFFSIVCLALVGIVLSGIVFFSMDIEVNQEKVVKIIENDRFIQ